jgi:radical SAM protein with 4Fe4S-binding SPASM domain
MELPASLFAKQKVLRLFCVPTWECSLRCPFCYVLPQLKSKDRFEVDVPAHEKFLRRYLEWNPACVETSISVFGGEPLLNQDNVRRYLSLGSVLAEGGRKVSRSLTTNLTRLDAESLDLIRQFDHVTVSLDGDEAHHNSQRPNFSLEKGENPFWSTLQNLKKLLDAGLGDNLTVQCVGSDEFLADEKRKAGFRMLLEAMGVPPKGIHIGCASPAGARSEASESFKKSSLLPRIRRSPCCVFQYMAYFCLHNNELHANYFDVTKKLGSLTEDMDTLSKRFYDYMWETMPVLNDPVCLECDVMQYCWGRCYGAEAPRSGPSKFCDQAGLRVKVAEEKAAGRLIDGDTEETTTHE